ncbi:hypothetical protein H5410_004299, partial [Solanum commersonii]
MSCVHTHTCTHTYKAIFYTCVHHSSSEALNTEVAVELYVYGRFTSKMDNNKILSKSMHSKAVFSLRRHA